MIIRAAEPFDAPAWEVMRRAMWPDNPDSHAREIAEFFAGTIGEPQAVFVAQEGRTLLAVAELSIRNDLAELAGKRVGYVEGIYIAAPFRGGGVVRQLLRVAEEWARNNGCDAFASDRGERIIVDPNF